MDIYKIEVNLRALKTTSEMMYLHHPESLRQSAVARQQLRDRLSRIVELANETLDELAIIE